MKNHKIYKIKKNLKVPEEKHKNNKNKLNKSSRDII